MKKAERNRGSTVKCAERERLWKAFLKVGKKWSSLQDRMRKVLKEGSTPGPDPARLEDIQIRIKTTHKLFGEHIAKQGCWLPKVSVLKGTKKRKHSK